MEHRHNSAPHYSRQRASLRRNSRATQTARVEEGAFYPPKLPLDTDNDLIIVNDSITPAAGEITHLSGKEPRPPSCARPTERLRTSNSSPVSLRCERLCF